MVIVKITPALGLAKMSDSALNQYCGERIAALTLHEGDFTGLLPTRATLVTQRNKYSTALDNLRRGDKSSTTTKNNERAKLENMMMTQADNAAEIAGEDVALYELLGYGMKSKATPTTELPAPANFSVKNGPVSGSIECRFKFVKNAHAYEVCVMDDTGKIVATATNSSSPVIAFDVAPLKQYKVKCRAIGSKNKKGTWTSEVTINVI
ncbi:MAG TPA: hypothetical protein VJY62_17560 [Bacteroidia bacterium]|nr:hypothetical protein [Bacteroidia bacterium]